MHAFIAPSEEEILNLAIVINLQKVYSSSHGQLKRSCFGVCFFSRSVYHLIKIFVIFFTSQINVFLVCFLLFLNLPLFSWKPTVFLEHSDISHLNQGPKPSGTEITDYLNRVKGGEILERTEIIWYLGWCMVTKIFRDLVIYLLKDSLEMVKGGVRIEKIKGMAFAGIFSSCWCWQLCLILRAEQNFSYLNNTRQETPAFLQSCYP